MAFRSMCASGFNFPRGMQPTFLMGGRNGNSYLIIGTAAAVTVGTLTLKLISHIRRQKRRQRWANVGKDKVVLHMLSRGRNCPNLSPFVMKLELYLRMAEIPYEVDFEEPEGPKGKTPWITLNGEEIADSQLIIKMLGAHFKKDLNTHLTSQDKAVATSMRIMIEDHFLWCLVIWRFAVDEMESIMKNIELSLYLMWLIFAFKGRVRKMTYLQGMGRHTNAEVEEFGKKDLQSLSAWLGDKPYFMGEKPTEVDCAIFGMLCQIEWVSQESPYFNMMKGDFRNLSSYCHRIKEKYWPDWNQCLNPKRA